MGMQHVQKSWSKAQGQKKSGQSQSMHMGVPTPTHTTGGSTSKPSMPKSNMANMMTPKFMSQGMTPQTGTGSPDSNGPATTWAKKSTS